MRPESSHALVTGGSSGIGLATACLLAQRGAHITLLARDVQRLQSARLQVESARKNDDQRVATVSADVSDRQAVDLAIDEAVRQISAPVDILVTCAGIAHPGYFDDLPIDVFERTMAVNYMGSLYAIRAVLPGMRQRRRGHLSLVSSGAGLVGLFGYTPYSPTKFALRGLAESLRGELVDDDIGLSIVYPPDTDTPQLEAENRTKPAETKAITASGGRWSAQGSPPASCGRSSVAPSSSPSVWK